MAGSKWNSTKSIPVSSLDDVSLREAIHEWAEGSQALEELLLFCNKNGLKTNGCDAGNHWHKPYLDILLEDSDLVLIEKLLYAVMDFEQGSKIIFRYGGNPKSGPDWYKTVVDIAPASKKDAELFWNHILMNLQKEKDIHKCRFCNYLLRIADFLTDKEPHIKIYLSKGSSKGEYTLQFCQNEVYYGKERYADIFEKVNLTKRDFIWHHDISVCGWEYITTNEEELDGILKNTYEVLTQKWSYELPMVALKDMANLTWAFIMRRKFGTDEEGVRKFEEWLDQNWGKPFEEMTF